MGFRTALDINAKCPLYESVVRTKRGNVAGVQCEFLCADSGFRASTIVKCGNFKETMDYKEIFCDDRYEGCPYFRAWILFNEGAKKKSHVGK